MIQSDLLATICPYRAQRSKLQLIMDRMPGFAKVRDSLLAYESYQHLTPMCSDAGAAKPN